jgi:dipeptidyl aminopeptidase/acylaminoacyl peptidase
MSRDLLSLPPEPADRRIAYGDDPNQFFDLWTPPEPRAVAMIIHGGYWRTKYDLTHVSHMCSVLARNGIAVASLEYRRVGNSGGGWPGTYEDVRAGFAAVQKHFSGEKKFLVLGHSSGGHLALRLAVDVPNITGVIALAPVAVLQTAYDLKLSNGAVVDFLGGTPETVPQIYEDACPARHPSSVQRILIHGPNDEDVPIALSKEFCELREHDTGAVWFMKLDDADHFDLIDPESRAWPMVHMNIDGLLDV